MVGILLLSAQDSRARITIDINSPGLTQFPISVVPFKPLGGSAAEQSLSSQLSDILGKDLLYTGYFKLISPTAALQSPDQMGITKEEIKFNAWSLVGVELLVTGGLSFVGNQLTLELRLFDVSGQSLMIGKRYTGDENSGPGMAHRFANEILRYLTGQEGYFLSRIAFAASDGKNKDIYMMNFDGQNIQRLTNYKNLSITPRFSPTGRELLFVSFKDGQPDLFLKSLSSGDTEKISARKGLNIAPSWSPDGSQIACTLSQDGEENLYLIDRKGRILNQLTKRWGINVSASWAPDGRRLAFVTNRSGNAQVYVMKVQTGEAERLTLDGKQNVDPAWSPRGDRIAFSGAVDGAKEIFTMKPNGMDRQQLTSTGGLNLSPCWSPDGSMIAFSSDRNGEMAIYVMNSNGANQRRLTFMKGTQESPSWSINLE